MFKGMDDYLYCLNNVLNGLRQALRAWDNHLGMFKKELKCECSNAGTTHYLH